MKAKVSKHEIISKLKTDNKRTTSISNLNSSGSYELNVSLSPVEVPKMLADWLDKYDGEYMGNIIQEIGLAANDSYTDYDVSDELTVWLKKYSNTVLATKAILYGYTVKPVQKWVAIVPNTEHKGNFNIYSWNVDVEGAEYVVSTNKRFTEENINEVPDICRFTEEELANFGINEVARIEVK